MVQHIHQTDMKDSRAMKPLKYKKRSHSSSQSSDESSDSDPDSQKAGSQDRITLSSDSEASSVDVRKPRKKKRHKYSDVENVNYNEESYNGKRHKHRCRHHHHHHRHHRTESGRNKEDKSHRRICSKHKAALEVVKIKEEPVDSDSNREQHAHSSRRKGEKRRERSSDDQTSRHDQHPATSTSSSGRRERREDSHRRREDSDERSEKSQSSQKQTDGTRRSNEKRSKEEEGTRRKNRPQGRRNRWGDDESTANASRPIKKEPEEEFEWGKKSNVDKDGKKLPPDEKDKPNFGLSGKLTEDTNMFNGVVIKYSEPPEARKPKRRWRFYPFKGEQDLPTLYIHRQSCYLIGRDRKVADIPIDHPSCSKQHAALQYRLVPFQRENGTLGKRVRPYIIDLESANGTYVNNVKVEAKTYVELLEKDVVKFGYSSREYVLLHEQSKDDELDDDVTGGPNE